MMNSKFKQTEIGMIPEEWEETTLGKLGELKNGVNFNRDDFGKGFPIINVTNLFRGRYATINNLNEIKETTLKNPEKYFLKRGDILFTRSSLKHSGTGQAAMVFSLPNKQTVFSGFIIRFRKNSKSNIDEQFLNYLVRSEFYREYIRRSMDGTTITNINQEFLSSLPIILPPIFEQHAIASILSSLDSKIELNQQMNKTLEAIGQALFKHWFVDFEFPNEEGRSYKSSGGEMVDSELGEVPRGWRVEILNNLLNSIESGRRPKGGIDLTLKEGVPSIGAENINGLGYYDYPSTKYISQDYFEQMKQGIVQDGDVLLYKDGAKLGRKTMFGKGFPFNVCCVNEHVFILRANEKLNQLFLYFWLDQNEITENIKNLNANSAQPGINKESVGTLKILVPEKSILDTFNKTMKSVIEKVFLNCLESRNLSQIRDSLLPKLMSGEIRVRVEVDNG